MTFSRSKSILLTVVFAVGLIACDDDSTSPAPADGALAPEAAFDVASLSVATSCSDVAPGTEVSWASAPASDEASEATEVRTLAKLYGGPDVPCLTDLQFRTVSPIEADDAEWSDWAPIGDGHGALEVPAATAGSSYLLAVQVRDADGDVDSALEWRRNVVHLRVAP